MQNYFPYSFVIGLLDSVKQSVTKHAYLADWNVRETESAPVKVSETVAISELYY